jgi:hypothetical protein
MIGYGQGRTETSMNRASLVNFVSLLVVFSFLTLNSIGDLPEKIAIHFDANGTADVPTANIGARYFNRSGRLRNAHFDNAVPTR